MPPPTGGGALLYAPPYLRGLGGQLPPQDPDPWGGTAPPPVGGALSSRGIQQNADVKTYGGGTGLGEIEQVET